MNVDIKTTKVCRLLNQSDKRITIMQGGARSGKTFNIIIWFLSYITQFNNTTLSICRDPYAAMPRSVIKDFLNILINNNLYDKNYHHKTLNQYKWFNNTIEFFGLDDQHKVQGPQREFLFVNEADNLNWHVFNQLLMRTEKKIVIDYNPNINEDHWIYAKLKNRDDCDFYITTYLDNPYLPETQKKEIENLKGTDKNLWNIYGLGILGIAENLVYNNYTIIDDMPQDGWFDDIVYGLDFGFNNPTAFVKLGLKDDEYYIQELLYESKLTNEDLKARIENFKINPNSYIYADSAEPARIEDLKRENLNIHPVKKIKNSKSKNSIEYGINIVKTKKLYITKDSANIIKEIKSYKWKEDKDGKILDEPIKFNDHAADAIRYAIMSFNFKQEIVYTPLN